MVHEPLDKIALHDKYELTPLPNQTLQRRKQITFLCNT